MIAAHHMPFAMGASCISAWHQNSPQCYQISTVPFQRRKHYVINITFVFAVATTVAATAGLHAGVAASAAGDMTQPREVSSMWGEARNRQHSQRPNIADAVSPPRVTLTQLPSATAAASEPSQRRVLQPCSTPDYKGRAGQHCPLCKPCCRGQPSLSCKQHKKAASKEAAAGWPSHAPLPPPPLLPPPHPDSLPALTPLGAAGRLEVLHSLQDLP